MRNLVAVALFICSLPCFSADKPKVVDWNRGYPNCTTIYVDGTPFERIVDGGRMIDVFTPILRDKHTYEVMVGVTNHGNANIDLDPSRFAALTNDASPIEMYPIDPDPKLAKEARSKGRWNTFATALAAGSSANTQATVTDSRGNTSEVTVDNPDAARQAETNGAQRQAQIDANYATESSHVLRHNTIAPGARVGGFVYLAKPKGMNKKSRINALAVDLGDTIYIFHYENGEVPKP
jgi:hypothetical protein